MSPDHLRVMVVDDTVTYRRILSDVIDGMGDAEVVATAPQGRLALARLQQGPVDLVLLDPPFESAQFESALRAASRAVAVSGYVYLEAPRAWTDEELAAYGFVCQRHMKAGAVPAHLLRPAAPSAA